MMRWSVAKQGGRPAYGQAGGAQAHLVNEGVAVGDLFLFYGRFRRFKASPFRRLRDSRYKNGDFQAVWGWLSIGEIVDLSKTSAPTGNRDHPHCHGAWSGENAMYVAAKSLGLDGFADAAGAGVLPALQPLTALRAPASQWWFDRSLFSRHRQEHVGDTLRDPEVRTIVKSILSDLVSAGR